MTLLKRTVDHTKNDRSSLELAGHTDKEMRSTNGAHGLQAAREEEGSSSQMQRYPRVRFQRKMNEDVDAQLLYECRRKSHQAMRTYTYLYCKTLWSLWLKERTALPRGLRDVKDYKIAKGVDFASPISVSIMNEKERRKILGRDTGTVVQEGVR